MASMISLQCAQFEFRIGISTSVEEHKRQSIGLRIPSSCCITAGAVAIAAGTLISDIYCRCSAGITLFLQNT